MKTRFFLKNLLMFLFPLLIPVLILGTLSIVATQQYLKAEANRKNQVLFHQIDRSLEQIFHEIQSLGISLDTAEMFYRLETLMRTQPLTLDELQQLRTVQAFINGPANAKPYIESVYVYANNEGSRFLASGEGLTTLAEHYDKDWFASYDQNRQQSGVWAESRQVRRYSFETALPVVTLYKNLQAAIRSPAGGVIVVNIRADHIRQVLDSLSTEAGQRIVVTDDKGRPVFQNTAAADIDQLPGMGEENETTTQTESKGGYLTSQSASVYAGWQYYSMIPLNELNRMPFRLSTWTGLIVAASFLLGLLLAYATARRNVNHIRSIIRLLQQAEAGFALPGNAPVGKGKDEYDLITQKIIQQYLERHLLKTQLSEEKYKHQAARLLALQAQINPHFLFNTLEAIYWRVFGLTGGPNEANRMLDRLSGLLRYSLDAPHETVPLERELESVRLYIEIQQIRYLGRFTAEFRYAPEEVAKVRVIKLILQPLIENAIHHGSRGEDLPPIRIRVTARLRHGHMLISIVDNGTGIERSRLDQIRRQLQSEAADQSNGHIGLANTAKRLQLAYGPEAGLRLLSKAGWGTSVSFRIPLTEQRQEATGRSSP